MRLGAISDATPAVDSPRSVDAQPIDISVVYFLDDCERSIRSSVRSVASQIGTQTCELIAVECGASPDVQDIFWREAEAAAATPTRVTSLHSISWNDGRFERFVQSLKGRYIAFLAADATWCDPNKLCEEACFLDQHGECYGVTSNYLRRYQRLGQFSTAWSPITEIGLLGHEQLIRLPIIPLLSATMFRADALASLKAPGISTAHVAWVFALLNAGTGFLGQRPQVAAVIDDWETTLLDGRGEAERAALLAQLRVIDRVTDGRYRNDLEALAEAYRRRIAEGAPW